MKLGTGGLSTQLTGTAQGAVAYYSTGKSWSELGPKRVIQGLLDGIDRDSILAQAREDIAGRLKSTFDLRPSTFDQKPLDFTRVYLKIIITIYENRGEQCQEDLLRE